MQKSEAIPLIQTKPADSDRKGGQAGQKRAAVIRAAVAGLAIVAIGLLHGMTPEPFAHWQYICQRLYYLPVVYAALCFGWRGGIAAAAFAGISYLQGAAVWRDLPGFALYQSLEIVVFFLVGVLTGVLADRERAQKRASEETVERLSKIYGELQENFDRMKRAERLYALGQLSAGLAHEIRNPLASIAGAAGILRRNRACDAKYEECLDIINKECARLSRLLTNFLDFARPRTPRYQRIALEPLLDSVIDLAMHAVDRKPIVLRKAIAPDAPPVETDPEQLKQVLLNLVINAVQATEESGGEIVLSAEFREGKALIEVRDQGRALSPALMERIFDPFFTTKEQGTGMGLSVAHQVVTQLGGILTARRNPDRGMTFSVQLPLEPEVPL
ncbi:MAG TPA: ATP-binding protein [Bryobacteraceae bacterium]|nr:ATP-binding protein [Bryobacteraceae bacterium]HOQ43785.1 ATP-binding protein [Bryobacteraceae bacterium]HPQ14895.1 ATP-binding protein [Bryobacteraceae bacterium]HPU71772.1 ATP-binding protein [Bryobacteraceae bacterium]